MAIISFNSNVLFVDTFNIQYETERNINKSVTGRTTINTRSEGRHVLDVVLVGFGHDAINAIRSAIIPVARSDDEIRLKLPADYYTYTGSYGSTQTVTSSVSRSAGANNIRFRQGATGSTRPSSQEFYSGMHFHVEGSYRIYVLQTYNATSGLGTFYPALDTSVDNTTLITFNNIYVVGHIVNNPTIKPFKSIPDLQRTIIKVEETIL